jgi:RNA polymerase sigma-70 factor (ECF subfamily)
MSQPLDEPPFADLLARLQERDQDAARELHRRFTPRLIALARQQFGWGLNGKVDPESVVQSVFGSFFHRFDQGQFELGDYDDLWGLLTVITMRKCASRCRYFFQDKRHIGREIRPDETGQHLEPHAPDPEPVELAILAETTDKLLTGFIDRERRIVEMLLAGDTVEEVRTTLECGERTVRRVRDRARAKLRRMSEV